MRRIIKSDLIVLPNGIFDGFIVIEDGKIAEITEKCPEGEIIDATGNYVMAGFIDIHTHGGGGFSFTESSPDEIVDGCVFHMTHGTTTIVPTVTTGAFPIMREAVKNIAIAKKNPLARTLLGAHMEGPYLSPSQCGAQEPDHITEPKPDEYISLLEETGDTIVRWTYAPERDPEGKFCKYLTDRGIIVSAGHTDAVYADMSLALRKGCRLITHLYSCTSSIIRRKGFRVAGVLEAAYYLDGVTATKGEQSLTVNVDLSGVDFTKAGQYTIVYSVDGEETTKEASVVIFGGKKVSVYHLSNSYKTATLREPPMLEGVDGNGETVIGIFESGAKKYSDSDFIVNSICEFKVK